MKEKWYELVKRKLNEKKKDGITRKRFAEIVGASNAAVGHWLNGTRSPSFADISKILHLVGIDSVILYSDGLVSEKDVRLPAKVEGVRVKGILQVDREWQPGEFLPLDTKQFVDFRSHDLNVFALQISGRGLAPRVKNTEYLIIEPGRKLQVYDDVLVYVKATGQYLMRTYLAAPESDGDPYALTDPNNGFVSGREENYGKNDVVLSYIAAIVNKRRLVK